jgi:hypothetical protein
MIAGKAPETVRQFLRLSQEACMTARPCIASRRTL